MSTYPPEVQARLDLERTISQEMADFSVDVALSLTQPWATLVAIGSKHFETRSWQARHRGWIAIHAAKGFPGDCAQLCYRQPFAACLAAAGYNKPEDLPRGEVIAIARLTDCISTNRWTPEGSIEYDFGNYGPDRFAWKLELVRRLKQPFAVKGALSLWKLPRPITLADLQ